VSGGPQPTFGVRRTFFQIEMDYKQWWTKSDRKESGLGQWLARLLMLLAKRKGRKSDDIISSIYSIHDSLSILAIYAFLEA
jgi:hypothetical protein